MVEPRSWFLARVSSALLITAAALALTSLAIRSHAQTPVSLELVLLADATGSIDNDEIRFQRMGYATAITDPLVVDAIINSGYGNIALTYGRITRRRMSLSRGL